MTVSYCTVPFIQICCRLIISTNIHHTNQINIKQQRHTSLEGSRPRALSLRPRTGLPRSRPRTRRIVLEVLPAKAMASRTPSLQTSWPFCPRCRPAIAKGHYSQIWVCYSRVCGLGWLRCYRVRGRLGLYIGFGFGLGNLAIAALGYSGPESLSTCIIAIFYSLLKLVLTSCMLLILVCCHQSQMCN